MSHHNIQRKVVDAENNIVEYVESDEPPEPGRLARYWQNIKRFLAVNWKNTKKSLKSSFDEIARGLPYLILIFGSLFALAMYSHSYKPQTYWAYPAILAVAFCIHLIVKKHFGKNYTKYIVFGSAIIFMILIAPFHTYKYKSSNTVSERMSSPTITRKLWTDEPIYYYHKPTGTLRSLQGPLTDSFKKHGKWEYVYWKPEFKIENHWFWYGEEISEGEWHLRNRE